MQAQMPQSANKDEKELVKAFKQQANSTFLKIW